MKALEWASGMAARRAWLWRNRNAFGASGMHRQPRLMVDVSTIIRHDARTGIQRVVRAIWSELSRRSGDDFEAVPVNASHTHGYCLAPPDFLDGGHVHPGTTPVTAGRGDKFLGLDLAAHVLPKYRAQLEGWRAHGTTVHLVVHDLLPIRRPEWFNPAMPRHFKRWFRTLAEVADQALCTSDDVAADLRNLLARACVRGGPAISRMYLGGDIAGSIPSRGRTASVQAALKAVTGRPFILMVGTVEPRKGYDVALKAFEHLWRESGGAAPDLVIVGRPGWKTGDLQQRLVSHAERGRRLHWLRDASDEALSELYHRCDGLFLASHAEGCGLPVLEAAIHGRNALVRDLSVFREKQLPNLSFFSDEQPGVLAAKIQELAAAPLYIAQKDSLPTWSSCTDALLKELGLAFHQEPAVSAEMQLAS